jgi:hypothetical protein
MRIAVAGATGHIGALTATTLERGGDDVVRISRSLGLDLLTGDGLDGALAAVAAVVDATNATATDPDEVVAYFGTTTRNLLAAEHRVGVRHHVLLSIVGIHRVEGNAHYAGKREQERLVEAGPVPWTIVPATQFHDFAAMVTCWTERDGVATIAPLLVQPIAPADIADVLAEVATGGAARALPGRRRPRDPGPRRHGAAHQRGARPPSSACPHVVGPVRPVDGRQRPAARRGGAHHAHHVRRVAGGGRRAVSQRTTREPQNKITPQQRGTRLRWLSVGFGFVSPLRHTSPSSDMLAEVCRAWWFSASFTTFIVRRVVDWPCNSAPTPDTLDVAFRLVRAYLPWHSSRDRRREPDRRDPGPISRPLTGRRRTALRMTDACSLTSSRQRV